MSKKLIAIFLALLCIGITACGTAGNGGEKTGSPVQSASSEALSFTDIKPEEAKERLEKEKGIVLLDVRTQEEYDEKYIPNSLLIPVDVIEKEAPLKLEDKNAAIFVYCRSGRRSVIASEALVKLGYTKVYNLGGINDWPYETASNSKSNK